MIGRAGPRWVVPAACMLALAMAPRAAVAGEGEGDEDEDGDEVAPVRFEPGAYVLLSPPSMGLWSTPTHPSAISMRYGLHAGYLSDQKRRFRWGAGGSVGGTYLRPEPGAMFHVPRVLAETRGGGGTERLFAYALFAAGFGLHVGAEVTGDRVPGGVFQVGVGAHYLVRKHFIIGVETYVEGAVFVPRSNGVARPYGVKGFGRTWLIGARF